MHFYLSFFYFSFGFGYSFRDAKRKNDRFRKTPLSPNELGRTVFMYCLSNDIRGYRSLYLTAKPMTDLGDVAGIWNNEE